MTELSATIEALLFCEPKEFSFKKLANICHTSFHDVREAVNILQRDYDVRDGGIIIVTDEEMVQMMTAPKHAKIIAEYLQDETTGELSRPSLETLTIIAYRGSVAKSEIELIRGINCSLILRLLLIRGLIEEHGATPTGSPIYHVTIEFLRHLGVTTVTELPDYNELHTNVHLQEFLAAQSSDFFKKTNDHEA